MTDIQEEKILEKLREKNIVPHQIAKATGLSDSTIKNYIIGKTKPTKTNLEAISRYFQNANIGNSLDSIIVDKEEQVRTLTEQVRTLTEQVRTLTGSLAKKDEQISKLIEAVTRIK